MLTTLLLLLALLFALPAMADDNINFTLSVEPSSLTAPGPVTVSVRVVNAGETDMTEPVMLYDPSGALVPTFGDGGQALIKKGDYVTAQHTYNVTQQQLDEGKLTYMLSYNDVDASGNVVVKSLSASAALTFTGTAPRLTVNRTIDPEVVRNGKTATVQYELYNSGNVEIKNIRVEENTSISANAQTVTSLAPGERKTIKFTATMRQNDLTSRGKVTYKAGDESLSQELPAVTIPKANPGLVLDEILTADKTSIENGDTVTLTLTIKNNGNITYSNISVTDAKYGEIFTNLTLGPGETLVREKQFTLSESTSFKYSVTLPDNTGATNVISSNEVKISVYNPGQMMHLTLDATASTATVAQVPADVRFTLKLTNNSSQTAKNVTLYHGATRITTVSELAPSQTVTIERDFTISQAGKFRFTASIKDALDNTQTFDSNEITIAYAAPTAAPTAVPQVTVAPLVTVTVAPIEVLEPVASQTSGYLRTAALVFAGLFGVSFLLFAVSTVMRAKRRSTSRNAYDHMDLAERRDYTEPARYGEADIADTEPETAPDALSEKPSDEILKEDAPQPVKQQSDDGGAYRLTREDSQPQPQASAQDQPAQDTPAEEAVDAPARRRRANRKPADAPSEDE